MYPKNFIDLNMDDDSPYDVYQKLLLLETKYVPMLDEKYPGFKADSWKMDEDEVSVSSKNISLDEDTISSFYSSTESEVETFISREQKVKNMIETFKEKKSIYKNAQIILDSMFPEFRDADFSKASHENDYFEAKTHSDILNFILKTLEENCEKKILIIPMHESFCEGTTSVLESKGFKDIRSDPEELKNVNIVVADIYKLAAYFRAFPIPDIIINLDVSTEAALFLNRLMLLRADNEDVKTMIFHVGSGMVKFMEEIFEKQ